LIVRVIFLLAISLQSTHGIILNCWFGMDSWVVIDSVYTCSITSVIDNETPVLEITGNHSPDKSNLDVEALLIRNTPISEIPKGFDDILPNLKLVSIDARNLTSISADDLKQFLNITVLGIGFSKITSLDSNFSLIIDFCNGLDFMTIKSEMSDTIC
jgi:hypothetical protein